LARAVRGGDTVTSAVSSTPAPAGESELIDQLVRNLARTGGIGDVPTRASPDVALVLAVLDACIEHGGPAAEPLDRAAGVLRARAADHADRQIHSAQARLSAQVLTILPAAMLLLLLVSSSSVRATIATPFGLVVVTIGAALNLIGWWWMRRIIDRAAR
jgi:Flp pilus assembly protein TadB